MGDVLLELSMPLGAYLLGAVPFALLIGWHAGIDLRAAGSGNPGAGNLTHTVGIWSGVTAAIADALKGLVPTYMAIRLGLSHAGVAFTGLAAVAGHNWPVYMRFRGGRGLATSAGVFLAVDPWLVVWPTLWSLAGWLIGGGLAGFIGWVPLPFLASMLDRPEPAALVATGVVLLALLRRAQGNSERRPGMAGALHRVVFDEDPPQEELAQS